MRVCTSWGLTTPCRGPRVRLLCCECTDCLHLAQLFWVSYTASIGLIIWQSKVTLHMGLNMGKRLYLLRKP